MQRLSKHLNAMANGNHTSEDCRNAWTVQQGSQQPQYYYERFIIASPMVEILDWLFPCINKKSCCLR